MAKGTSRGRLIFRKIVKVFKWAIILFFGSSILVTVLYRWINPPITPLMVKRLVEQVQDGKPLKLSKDWVSIDEISGSMSMAVIASEDNNFLKHHGIDIGAIRKAVEANKTRKRKLGASTITQQTAKNVFLFPSRTYFRKGLELYFTGLIELIWGKERIMEVYLNVIEMGDGIYGVEEAAQTYFRKPASALNKHEAALIAAILPSPRRYSAQKPGPYVRKRAAQIANLSGKLTRPEWVERKK